MLKSIYDESELADIIKTKFGAEYFQFYCKTDGLDNFCTFKFSAEFMKEVKAILNTETLEGITFVCTVS